MEGVEVCRWERGGGRTGYNSAAVVERCRECIVERKIPFYNSVGC